MLSSIHPLGERARSNRWGLTATSHVVGTTLGGAATGAAAGALGWLVGLGRLPGPAAAAVIVVGAASSALVDGARIDGRRRPFSHVHRQVDPNWLQELRGWVYGVGYGVQLGCGLLTIVVTTTVYLTWLLASLTADPVTGAVVGSVFGIARGALLLTGWRLTDADRLRDFHHRLDDLRRPIARCVPLATLAVGIIAASTLIP